MPTIIDMLEKLGQDANLQTPEALQAAKADLAEQVRRQATPVNAIVLAADEDEAVNTDTLANAMGLEPIKCVTIIPAEDDDGSDDNEEKALQAA